MVQSPDLSSSVAGRSAVADDELESALHALATLGLRVRLHQCGARLMTAGVTARVALGSLAASGLRTRVVPDHGLSVVYAALRAGIPVTVTIIDPAGAASDDSLLAFRHKFGEFLEAAAIDRRLLGLCLSAGELPSRELQSGIRRTLGDGPRFVMLHGTGDRKDGGDEIWPLLRREEHGAPRFWPVFPAGVRSQCPLLCGESSSGILPGTGLAVPLGSAWLPIELDLCDFADQRGTINGNRLDRALDASIVHGDLLLDRLRWFDRQQRDDAARNRRLAICLGGIGRLLRRQGDSPGAFHSLKRLDGLVDAVRARLLHRSQQLAKTCGAVPALNEHSPGDAWRDEQQREAWLSRWQAAVSSVQLRHRNLLAMSPYTLLPERQASPESADLLPLLAHADALFFSGPPSLRHWKMSEFRGFYRRVAAQVERHNAASFVAAGV